MTQKKIIAVLDTNILVSGILSPHGVPGHILQKFRMHAFDFASSPEQFLEIQKVLQRPSVIRCLPKGISLDASNFVNIFKKNEVTTQRRR